MGVEVWRPALAPIHQNIHKAVDLFHLDEMWRGS
jgi:hypothetical protein